MHHLRWAGQEELPARSEEQASLHRPTPRGLWGERMKDLNYAHLTPEQQATAKQVVDWLKPRISAGDEQWIDGGGCNLFAGEYSSIYSVTTTRGTAYRTTQHDAHLFLVYDGGGFYDMLSYNGEFSQHGIGLGDSLMSHLESLGYTCEQVDNICMAVYV